MGDIALPQTAQQELGARGIHLFLKGEHGDQKRQHGVHKKVQLVLHLSRSRQTAYTGIVHRSIDRIPLEVRHPCSSPDIRITPGSHVPFGISIFLISSGNKPVSLMADAGKKRAILIVASLASFLVPYTGSSITVALPAIGAEFGLDAVMLGWITAAYIISAAVFIVPFGRLSDIIGRKKVFLWGVAIFSAASFLSSLAQSHLILFAARFVQGIGGAMLFATSVAIVTAVFEPGSGGGRWE
jgi:hypothetical protein